MARCTGAAPVSSPLTTECLSDRPTARKVSGRGESNSQSTGFEPVAMPFRYAPSVTTCTLSPSRASISVGSATQPASTPESVHGSCAVVSLLSVGLFRLFQVVVITEHLTLGNLFRSILFRPTPKPGSLFQPGVLCAWVDVVEFEIDVRTAHSADLISEEVRPPLCNPQTLVLFLFFRCRTRQSAFSPLLNAASETRTLNLRGLDPAPLPIGLMPRCGPIEWIRTTTGSLLRTVPLLLGYDGEDGAPAGTRIQTADLKRVACCVDTTGAKWSTHWGSNPD